MSILLKVENLTVSRIKLFLLLCDAFNACFCRGTEVSDCGNYVILYVSRGAEPKNLLYFYDLRNLPNKEITGRHIHTCSVKCI